MKNKEFEQIGKALLPDMPGFAAKANLVYARPIGHTLRALCFNRSIDPRAFYVEVFIMPLYVPTEVIGFNLGDRLSRGSAVWNADDPDLIVELRATIKRKALPFLQSAETPLDVARTAVAMKSRDPYVKEAIAYSYARAGEVKPAVAALDELVRSLDQTMPWHRPMAERAHALAVQLLTDPTGAQRQLDAWERQSWRNLGLDKLP